MFLRWGKGCALIAVAVWSAGSVIAQTSAAQAPGGLLRVLDRTTGRSQDISLAVGEYVEVGLLQIRLQDCRYPVDNPSGDAFVRVDVQYGEDHLPVFAGWMIASSPALNPVDHPRYDLWPLSCIRS